MQVRACRQKEECLITNGQHSPDPSSPPTARVCRNHLSVLSRACRAQSRSAQHTPHTSTPLQLVYCLCPRRPPTPPLATTRQSPPTPRGPCLRRPHRRRSHRRVLQPSARCTLATRRATQLTWIEIMPARIADGRPRFALHLRGLEPNWLSESCSPAESQRDYAACVLGIKAPPEGLVLVLDAMPSSSGEPAQPDGGHRSWRWVGGDGQTHQMWPKG